MLRPVAGLEGERTVMGEITAYWQKALGKTSILGQASNRPPSRQPAHVPEPLEPKSLSGQAKPGQTFMEPPNLVAESNESKALRSG